jgi:hypothetical protein
MYKLIMVLHVKETIGLGRIYRMIREFELVAPPSIGLTLCSYSDENGDFELVIKVLYYDVDRHVFCTNAENYDDDFDSCIKYWEKHGFKLE